MHMRKLFGDLPADTSPSLLNYLLMNVEDAEYPTAVPLAALTLAGISVYYTVTGISRTFGLFAHHENNQDSKNKAFLDIDGPGM